MTNIHDTKILNPLFRFLDFLSKIRIEIITPTKPLTSDTIVSRAFPHSAIHFLGFINVIRL